MFNIEYIPVITTDSKIEFKLNIQTNYKEKIISNFVEFEIPVPKNSQNFKIKCSKGSGKYNPEKDCVVWKIKSIGGKKKASINCSLSVNSIAVDHSYKSIPIMVNFEIPYYTLSGINVRFLKITEKSNYHSMSWVRYIVRNGEFAMRKPIN